MAQGKAAEKVILSDEKDGERIGFETSNYNNVIDDVFAAKQVAWELIQRRKLDPRDPESVTDALRTLGKVQDGRFTNLVETYPVLTRHMVTTADVDRGTMEKYFAWVAQNIWQTQEEFLTVQARYYYYLARHQKKSKVEAEEIFEQTKKTLLDEDRQFRDIAEEAMRKYHEDEEEMKKSMISALKELAVDAAEAKK